MNSPVELKVAYVGGGSRDWARKLMGDLAVCPDLCGEMALYDIDPAAAQLNAELGNWIGALPGAVGRWHYRAVESLAVALRGADVVFLSIQPGPLELMDREISVCERYGLFFPVGDTIGAPGLMRSLRSAVIYAGFARAIAETCPAAWVINYTNPMSVCTRTLTKVAPGLKVFGCCHEVFSTQAMLAEIAQRYLDLPELPGRDEIRVNVTGINHFTWIDRATYRGHDLLALLRRHIDEPGVCRPYTRQEVEARHSWFYDNRQVKFELFRRYGILAAAGDRHLCEFVPGFISSPERLFRWGVIRTPMTYRFARWDEGKQAALDYLAGRKPFPLAASKEEAVRQIRALVGLEDFVTNINAANRGQVSNLPPDAVVETNAYLSRDSVQPVTAGALPPGVHGLIALHVANQELIVEAALTRDRDLAFQAVFNDPNTNLPIDEARQMFEEIGLPDW